MNGNAKTLLTSSRPKGPHPYPLLGCRTSRERLAFLGRFPPQILHVCEHPHVCQYTCVCLQTSGLKQAQTLSPSEACLQPWATLTVGFPYLGPSLSASGPVSCLSEAEGCISNAGSTRALALTACSVNHSCPLSWLCRAASHTLEMSLETLSGPRQLARPLPTPVLWWGPGKGSGKPRGLPRDPRWPLPEPPPGRPGPLGKGPRRPRGAPPGQRALAGLTEGVARTSTPPQHSHSPNLSPKLLSPHCSQGPASQRAPWVSLFLVGRPAWPSVLTSHEGNYSALLPALFPRGRARRGCTTQELAGMLLPSRAAPSSPTCSPWEGRCGD